MLNADKNFTSSRQRVEYQLKKIDDTLKAQVKDLFYDRKFDLHTLFKNSEEKDLQDLTLLQGICTVDNENTEGESLHR